MMGKAAKRAESAKMGKQLAILEDNLTKLRFKQKRYDEAEIQGRKAVALLNKTFGPTVLSSPIPNNSS